MYKAPYAPVQFRYTFPKGAYQAEHNPEELPEEVTLEAFAKALQGAGMSIATTALGHLHHSFKLQGGVVDPDGEHWVYKSAQDFVDSYRRTAAGCLDFLIPSTRTFERVLTVIARFGIVERCLVTLQQRRGGGECYAYKPGPNWNWIQEQLENRFVGAVSDPSAVPSDPSDTGVGIQNHSARHYYKQSFRSLSTAEPFHNPGARLFVPDPWQREQIEEQYRQIQEQQPDPPPLEEPTEDRTDPVEPPPDPVTDPTLPRGVLNLLNTAKIRCWVYDKASRLFRNKHNFMTKTVEAAVRDYACDLDPAEVRKHLEHYSDNPPC